jgi:hypothetical protein
LVEDQEEALLVPQNDLKDMAATVRRILTEPGLAAKLSANARSRAEKLEIEAIGQRLEAIGRTNIISTYSPLPIAPRLSYDSDFFSSSFSNGTTVNRSPTMP